MVVTGAGSGIGRAIAQRLGREGYAVSLTGRRIEPLRVVADELASIGARAHAVSCDQRDRGSVHRAFQEISTKLGAIHGLIANAGLGGENHPGPDDRFDDIVATNLHGTYHCLRAFERHLAPGSGERHVVVTSSILGRFGVPGYTAYCASKAGLLGLVKASALELAPRNVMVNAICPGWVSTDMAWQGIDGFAKAAGKSREEAFAEAMKPVPLGRMSEPLEIAGLVAFLLSNESRGITGQALDMNNGAWMG